MTTLLQFYKCIQGQLLENPESANYEVAFVDEATSTEVGTTPIGLYPFIGVSDDIKKFDFYCNIPKDTIDEYMENRSEDEKHYNIEGADDKELYKEIKKVEDKFIDDLNRKITMGALFGG